MTRIETRPTSLTRTWLSWTVGFLAFPLAGFCGTAVAGRVDDPLSALLGGAVAGLVIGTGQALASRRRLRLRRWIPATSIGMSLGLLLGASTVGYRTTLADLALMGALTGVVLGIAQTFTLPRNAKPRWLWAAGMPILWALGWTVTTIAGIAVEEQFTNFGAFGALTFSALSGLLLLYLLPHSGRKDWQTRNQEAPTGAARRGSAQPSGSPPPEGELNVGGFRNRSRGSGS